MGIDQIGVSTHALTLLVVSGVLSEKEVKEAMKNGNEGLVELLKERGEKHRNDFNERVRTETEEN